MSETTHPPDAAAATPGTPATPEAAAARLATAFLTPRRLAPQPDESALLAQARRSAVPCPAALADGAVLPAWTWGPDDPAAPTALLVHGWDSRGSHLGAWVAPLLAAGWRVLAFDAPAHGDAPGPQSSVVHHARAVQAVAAAQGPVHGVVAHSVGSAAARLAFAEGLRPRASVHLAGPSSVREVAQAVAMQARLPQAAWPAYQAAIERFAGLPMAALEPAALAPGLKHPALLLHDPQDAEIPYACSEAVQRHWPGSELVPTPGTGHRRLLRDEAVVRRGVDFLVAALRRAAG